MRIYVLGMVCFFLCWQARSDVPAPLHVIEFDTDEGTSISVDVSPDGKTLVFDLLGGLYTMPITGGKAEPLLSGPSSDRSWNRSPRFSPDGRQISFISDRGGVNNIWVLDLMSHKIRQITWAHAESLSPLGEVTGTPEWLPGGREIAYGMFRSTISMAIVPREGSKPRLLLGTGEQPPGESLRSAFSASFTPDGGKAFLSAWGVHLEGNSQKVELRRFYEEVRQAIYCLDLGSHVLTRVTTPSENRDEFKPQVSKSGRFLAYARRESRHDPELRIRDLQNGEDRHLTMLLDAADPGSSGAGYMSDSIPAYAFTPNDRFLVIWYAGKLHKVSVADGSSMVIPFSVHVVRQAAEPVRGHYRILDTPLHVRAIRWPTVSPDGTKLVFSAVGSLWMTELPNGKPQRLTQSEDFEFMPAFSPDGSQLAYVAFPHSEDEIQTPGRLMILTMKTRETRAAIGDLANYYVPSWSPDGQRLAVVREILSVRGPTFINGAYRDNVAFGWINLATQSFHAVAPASTFRYLNQQVSFSKDGTRLLYVRSGEPGATLRSVGIDGTGERELLKTGPLDVLGIIPSPDGSKAVLLGYDFKAYLVSLSAGDLQPLSAFTKDNRGEKIKATLISEGGALFLRWTDSQTLTYSWTKEIYRYRVGETTGKLLKHVELHVPRRGGEGTVAFRNARLITIDGEHGAGRVIERGTIVVHDRRIAALGPVEQVPIPAGAKVIDATNLTIMPGLIDSHDHGIDTDRRGVSQLGIPIGPTPTRQAALAYGVTTAWDAGGSNDDGDLSLVELIEAGRLRWQRWLSSAGRINRCIGSECETYRDFETAEAWIQTLVSLGGEQCLKNYGSPDRITTQWLAEAARRAGVCVVAHTNYPGNLLSRAADGYAVDHPMLAAPSYRDVVQFLARTGVIWTPNLQLALPPENFNDAAFALANDRTIGEMRVFDNSAQLRKMERYGPAWLEQLKHSQGSIPYEQTLVAKMARLAAQISVAGGKITASVDGRHPFTNHIELWVLNHGGISTGDVLRAATLTGAQKLGIQDDVGSLEPGKLADFIVLTKNPLEKIENSLTLKYTVLSGAIYDSDTLALLSSAGTR